MNFNVESDCLSEIQTGWLSSSILTHKVYGLIF